MQGIHIVPGLVCVCGGVDAHTGSHTICTHTPKILVTDSLFVSLVYCAESTVRWFIVREKYCWMTADSERCGSHICKEDHVRCGWAMGAVPCRNMMHGNCSNCTTSTCPIVCLWRLTSPVLDRTAHGMEINQSALQRGEAGVTQGKMTSPVL
jgi:hypothetical protein